jgi:hypothetical protein
MALFMLSATEQQRLTAHLSLGGNARALREHFGINEESLHKASVGEHLAGEVIARLRGVLLGNGGAA